MTEMPWGIINDYRKRSASAQIYHYGISLVSIRISLFIFSQRMAVGEVLYLVIIMAMFLK